MRATQACRLKKITNKTTSAKSSTWASSSNGVMIAKMCRLRSLRISSFTARSWNRTTNLRTSCHLLLPSATALCPNSRSAALIGSNWMWSQPRCRGYWIQLREGTNLWPKACQVAWGVCTKLMVCLLKQTRLNQTTVLWDTTSPSPNLSSLPCSRLVPKWPPRCVTSTRNEK